MPLGEDIRHQFWASAPAAMPSFCCRYRTGASGRWIPTTPQFVDPLVPEWAATLPYQKHKPRDLPTKTEFFVNVLASEAVNNELVLSVEEWPGRLRKIFQAHGRYRLKIVVTGDQVKPKTVFVIVTWTGNWKFDSSRPLSFIFSDQSHAARAANG